MPLFVRYVCVYFVSYLVMFVDRPFVHSFFLPLVRSLFLYVDLFLKVCSSLVMSFVISLCVSVSPSVVFIWLFRSLGISLGMYVFL